MISVFFKGDRPLIVNGSDTAVATTSAVSDPASSLLCDGFNTSKVRIKLHKSMQ